MSTTPDGIDYSKLTHRQQGHEICRRLRKEDALTLHEMHHMVRDALNNQKNEGFTGYGNVMTVPPLDQYYGLTRSAKRMARCLRHVIGGQLVDHKVATVARQMTANSNWVPRDLIGDVLARNHNTPMTPVALGRSLKRNGYQIATRRNEVTGKPEQHVGAPGAPKRVNKGVVNARPPVTAPAPEPEPVYTRIPRREPGPGFDRHNPRNAVEREMAEQMAHHQDLTEHQQRMVDAIKRGEY